MLAVPAAAQEATTLRSLASVYEGAVRDTNGDGLADLVAARVILPASPTLEDVQAASNIAARLGYETTAASLPVVLRDDGADLKSVTLPILVGRTNRFVKALIASGDIDLAPVKAGQGLVAFVPDAIAGHAGVVVVGGDDAGTVSAAVQLAARLPHLWNQTGITLPAIEQAAVAYLKDRDVTATQAVVTALVVDTDRRGLANVRLRVRVVPGDEAGALKALGELVSAHRFGELVEVLNLPSVAVMSVEIVGEHGRSGSVAVPRVGPNWRSLLPAPPIPPAPTTIQVGRPGPVAPTPSGPCANCFRNMYDGMMLGGGGAGYTPAVPTRPAAAKSFDLSNTYSIDGWFGDLYRDLAPDSTETSVVVGGDPAEASGAADIAARLGLETTGITLPIAKRDADVPRPENEPSPILVGRGNRLVQALIQGGRLSADPLAKGEGAIELVPQAFGNATATVVTGADAAGAAAASSQLARRLPFVWDTRAGSPTLATVKSETADFFAVRNSPGQAAQALNVLGEVLDGWQRGGIRPERIDARIYLQEANGGFAKYVRDRVHERLADARVSVATQAITDAVPVAGDSQKMTWEVDDLRDRFRSALLPHVRAGSRVDLDATLSEAPAARARIAAELQGELAKAGAAGPHVTIRSAYKQGFFWLTEQVLPALKNKGVKAVHITVRTAATDASKGYRYNAMPTRWIKELYPADEIFRRDLGVAYDDFRIEQVDQATNTYAVEASDAAGNVVYRSVFDPSVIEREMFDAFPGRSRLDVETGHVRASVDGATVLDERVRTDLEKVWDHFQAVILPRARDYVMRVTDGKPSRDQAPHFRDLKIDVTMSEPDYALGIEGEQISAPEGLAHDMYMLANSFFAYSGMPSAGRVIPVIQGTGTGGAAVRFALTDSAAKGPRIELRYRLAGRADDQTETHELTPIGVDAPRVTRIVAGADRLRQIGLQVTTADAAAETRAAAALHALAELRGAGLYRSGLSYDHVDNLAITVAGTAKPTTVTLAYGGVARPSDVRRALVAPPRPLVTFDHIIDPAESEAIIGKLAQYPAMTAYRAGRSFEGRDISAIEIANPTPSALVSQAKLSAYKPGIFLVGRQHGNEPSSTSYMLKMAEELVTNPAYADIVRKVNVVMLPVMNPDGAALAGEIRRSRPFDIAQPGYLSALSRDVLYDGAGKLPEAGIDPMLWRKWLPDIYLNAHGASSHEVVQPFSGYASSGAPTYSFRRGWYSIAFQTPNDPRDPGRTAAALALRDRMAAEIASNPQALAANQLDYDRFRRWGHRFAPHMEAIEMHGDTMLFYSDPTSGALMGNRRLPAPPAESTEANRRAEMVDWPLVTLDAGTFEAADEGLASAYLPLAAQNGFAAVLAHLKYLRDGSYVVQRIAEDAPGDGAKLTTLRLRPVMPPRLEAGK
jgi:hypothetical protein